KADVSLARVRVDIFSQEEGQPDLVLPTQASANDLVLDFPAAIGFGLSWRPKNALPLPADCTPTFCAYARIHNYFVLLPPSGPTEPRPPFTADTLVYPNVRADEQADSVQVRAGVEYVLIKSGLKIPLRAGYFNDQQYTLDAQGNSPHFNALTLGTGGTLGAAPCDAAYLYESGHYIEPLTNTRTKVTSRRFFASLSYRWGGVH